MKFLKNNLKFFLLLIIGFSLFSTAPLTIRHPTTYFTLPKLNGNQTRQLTPKQKRAYLLATQKVDFEYMRLYQVNTSKLTNNFLKTCDYQFNKALEDYINLVKQLLTFINKSDKKTDKKSAVAKK
jgi:hypothetical protein